MDVFITKRTAGVEGVPFEAYRDKASEVRLHVLDNLSDYVDQFSAAATKAGAVVYRAKDAEGARDTVLHVLRDRGVRTVVKAKSMVTEEIHLNSHLQTHGIQVWETDLGEYIVQLAGERPSHILAPAIHKTRQQIGRLFAEKLGVPYSEDPKVLTRIARRALREVFLSADAGISGANFAVAHTGSLVIFTNEGNGRMVTTLPRLHVAVLSMEKMIPTLEDLVTFVRLLPRSASGQALSSYVSIITGTRKASEATGAREVHIVILDNGRSQILQGPYREILKCIRCSACINVCPVYRVIGGHAYGATYSGPMGIVLTTLLEGMNTVHPLLDATTLCGACADVCPVRVPLVHLLRSLRERRVDEGYLPNLEKAAMHGFGLATSHPALYGFAQGALRSLWPLLKSLGRDAKIERLPPPAARPLSKR